MQAALLTLTLVGTVSTEGIKIDGIANFGILLLIYNKEKGDNSTLPWMPGSRMSWFR